MKKIISFFVCFVILFSALNASVSAENELFGGNITIDNVTGNPGDEVLVAFNISDNPGIMAMTITLRYDPEVLTYVDFKMGVLRDYLMVDHGGYLRFVNCDSGNNKRNGSLFVLVFKIKDNAAFGNSPVTLEYNTGDFCDYYLKKLMPVVKNGSVEVKRTQANCKHKFGKWEVKSQATCLQGGDKSRTCSICGKSERVESDKTGHNYSSDFTIDKVAVPGESGEMSKHCLNPGCDAKTDIKNFSVEDSLEEGFENKDGSNIKDPSTPVNGNDNNSSNSSGDINNNQGNSNNEIDTPGEKKPDNNSGFFQRLLTYFFGDDDTTGVIEIINNSIPSSDKKTTGLKYFFLYFITGFTI